MTTPIEVRAPAEQTEGTRSQLLRWLKQPGDAVTENEPFRVVNGIALPLMSDSDVPTPGLAIVIVSVPTKVGLTV